jgi:hypothetical protein
MSNGPILRTIYHATHGTRTKHGLWDFSAYFVSSVVKNSRGVCGSDDIGQTFQRGVLVEPISAAYPLLQSLRNSSKKRLDRFRQLKPHKKALFDERDHP